MRKLPERVGFAIVAALAFVAGVSTASAQSPRLGDSCTIQILNQTGYVQPDGTWLISNVPSDLGPIRARMYCDGPEGPSRGQSGFFEIFRNQTREIPDIPVSPIDPGPTRVDVRSSRYLFEATSESGQIQVIGHYPGRVQKDITARALGTSYESSNPDIVSVDEQGRLAAHRSGQVLITAWNMGMAGTTQITAALGGDADLDGIPDDYELFVGLDPTDPLDAAADQDGDGLTASEEFFIGSHPFRADTDGDGLADDVEIDASGDGHTTDPTEVDTDHDRLPDAVEQAVGSDPTDPQSTGWAAALTEIRVRPGGLSMAVGPLADKTPRQLAVSAGLVDGTAVDVTPVATYTTTNPIVEFDINVPGLVSALLPGTTIINVSFQGANFDVPVTIVRPTLQPVGVFALPALCFDVVLVDDVAFLPCQDKGLVIIDPLAPLARAYMAELPLASYAVDLEVIDGTAWIVMADGRLAAVDVRVPRQPHLIAYHQVIAGSGITGRGIARDGDRLAVALGTAGVAIVDISGPTPTTTMVIPDVVANAVALQGSRLAVVDADDAFTLVDLDSPSAPHPSLAIDFLRLRQIVLDGDTAYVATDGFNGLAIVDITDASAPALTQLGLGFDDGGIQFIVRDIAKFGDRVFGADIFRVSAIPIVDVSDPLDPDFVDVIDFPGTDANGSGVDVGPSLAAVTAGASIDQPNQLFVGRHTAPVIRLGPEPPVGIGQKDPTLTGTGDFIPPFVEIQEPVPNALLFAASPLHVSVFAIDDSALIDHVDIRIDDVPVATLAAPPFETDINLAPDLYVLTAKAVDQAGNARISKPVIVVMRPPPYTDVLGRVVDQAGLPVGGAQVDVGGSFSVYTDRFGQFAKYHYLAAGPFSVDVSVGPDTTSFGPFTPVEDGTTQVGDLVVARPVGLLPEGAIVSEAVMVELVDPPGVGRYREDFTTLAAIDPPTRQVFLEAPGVLAPAMFTVSEPGTGQDGALNVAAGATVTLPNATYEFTDATIDGRVIFEAPNASLSIAGDLTGTGGRIEGPATGTLTVVVGGALDLALDEARPVSEQGIHATEGLHVELGVNGPVDSSSDAPITVTSGTLFIGSLGSLVLGGAHGDIAVEEVGASYAYGPNVHVSVHGDFVADEIKGGAEVAGRFNVGNVVIESTGALELRSVEGGETIATEYPYGAGFDVTIAAAGRVALETVATHGASRINIATDGDLVASGPIRTADVAIDGDYVGPGSIELAVLGDADLDVVATGDNIGTQPIPGAPLGGLQVRVAGALRYRRLATGRGNGTVIGAQVTVNAGTLAPAPGAVIETSALVDHSTIASIYIVANEVRGDGLVFRTGAAQDGDPATASAYPGSVNVNARSVALTNSTIETGLGGSHGSGAIAIYASEAVALHDTTVRTGDLTCPAAGYSGSVFLEAGTSAALTGTTLVHVGGALESCETFLGGSILLSGGEAYVQAPSATLERGSSQYPGATTAGVAAPQSQVQRTQPTQHMLGSAYTSTRSVLLSSAFLPTVVPLATDFRQRGDSESQTVDYVALAITSNAMCVDYPYFYGNAAGLYGSDFAWQAQLSTFGPLFPRLDGVDVVWLPTSCDLAPDPIGACDDAVACTVDTCDSGVCVHTPEDQNCDPATCGAP